MQLRGMSKSSMSSGCLLLELYYRIHSLGLPSLNKLPMFLGLWSLARIQRQRQWINLETLLTFPASHLFYLHFSGP